MNKQFRWLGACVLVLAAVACTGGDGGNGGAADDDDDDANPCPRPLAAADRVRFGAVGLPFDSEGTPGNSYEIVRMEVDGSLTFTGTIFTMARPRSVGDIVFTPDGEVGITAQDDGTLGVFTVDEDGAVTVVHQAFEGSFYAGEVVMDPGGERAWVLDTNTFGNGGGVYSVAIECDGTLRDDGLVVAGNLPYGMVLRSADTAVLYSKGIGEPDAAGDDLHKVELDPFTVGPGTDAFPGGGDVDAIVSDMAVTDDGNFVLVADNAAFAIGNRVSVVDLVPATPVHVQTIGAIEDPIGLAVSPYGDLVLVASGFGNAVFVIDYDGGALPPFGGPVELTYTGAGPQLPGAMVTMTRGEVDGLVLMAELSGIRRIRFDGSGEVTDLGLADSGGGIDRIVGPIGFPP